MSGRLLPSVCLVATLAVVILIGAGTASAGVVEVRPDSPLIVARLGPEYVCLRDGSADAGLMWDERDGVSFGQVEGVGGVRCAWVEAPLRFTTGANTTVLVLPSIPERLDAPGVATLDVREATLLLAPVTADSRILVLEQGPEIHHRAITSGFGSLPKTVAVQQVYDGFAEDVDAVWIEVTSADTQSVAFVTWDDPSWYPRAPSVGVVAAVAVGALLLVFWSGRLPRSGA